MKKILVPIDFSEKSNEALDVAVQLSKKNKAIIYLLHCVELPTRYVTRSASELPEVLFFMKLAENKISEVSRSLNEQGVKNVSVLLDEKLSYAVNKIVEKEKIDLVVIGSTGASGMKEVLIGSNTEKVVRYCEVPVLVVKDPLKINKIKKITFAYDFSLKYKKAIEEALKFADFVGAKIDFVYVNTPQKFHSTSQINALTKDFVKNHKALKSHNLVIYNDFNVEEGIMNFSEENKSDLICVFPAKRNELAHFFNISTSEDIVNHSDKPILTIKL